MIETELNFGGVMFPGGPDMGGEVPKGVETAGQNEAIEPATALYLAYILEAERRFPEAWQVKSIIERDKGQYDQLSPGQKQLVEEQQAKLEGLSDDQIMNTLGQYSEPFLAKTEDPGEEVEGMRKAA